MIDNYNYQLNQSHKNLDNKEYIRISTEIMSTTLKNQEKKETLLVVGAGNLTDVDLNFFLSVFETIYLSDIDILSIKQSLGESLRTYQFAKKFNKKFDSIYFTDLYTIIL